MGPACRTIQSLHELAADAVDVGLASASRAALGIISDINASGMTDHDALCLTQLVDALYREGHADLVAHLEADAADCAICLVLKQKIAGRRLAA